ncbi:hypothetical protein [Marinicella sp. W31]|uniref:hypothetical protein n=1 Tax=Marinicella sp. W31 TaxID=3023713 RepID=UPI0037580E4F
MKKMIKEKLDECLKQNKGVICYLKGGQDIPMVVKKVDDIEVYGSSRQYTHISLSLSAIIGIAFN